MDSKDVKKENEKKPLTAYMFYLQIRRVELRNEIESSAEGGEKSKVSDYNPKEILRIVS